MVHLLFRTFDKLCILIYYVQSLIHYMNIIVISCYHAKKENKRIRIKKKKLHEKIAHTKWLLQTFPCFECVLLTTDECNDKSDARNDGRKKRDFQPMSETFFR